MGSTEGQRRRSRRYYAKNRDKYQAWRDEHREEQRAYNRRYYLEHKEKLKAQAKAWAEENPEKRRQIDRDWYANHTEKRLRSNAAWAANHPLHVAAKKNRRRGRSAAASGSCSSEQLSARVEYYGWRCAYCGGAYECIDHVIPLARGGSNWPANLRPACRRCNLSKGSRSLSEWLKTRRAAEATRGPSSHRQG